MGLGVTGRRNYDGLAVSVMNGTSLKQFFRRMSLGTTLSLEEEP